MLKDISKETSLAKVTAFIKESARICPKSSCEDIDTLNYKEKSGALIIDRSYQRNFIQTLEGASAYVESIFLGLIIPEIQLFEDYNTGRREIIDGQQRVLSLLKFYRGEYPLTKLKELPELNGLYFNDLPVELQGVIRNFQINIRTFTNEDELYKYVIFERLNTGAKKLNSQEVRNCVYRGEMLESVKSISKEQDIIDLFKGIKNKRFERDEQILNIISLMYFFNDEDGKKLGCRDLMKRRINDFLEVSSSFSEEQINNIRERFLELTDFIACCVDIDEAMSLMYEGALGHIVIKTLYETLYLGLDAYDLTKCEPKIDELKDAIYKVFASDEYKETLGLSSSKSSRMVRSRNNTIKKAIDAVL